MKALRHNTFYEIVGFRPAQTLAAAPTENRNCMAQRRRKVLGEIIL
jgi:hypothetical protein